MDGSASSPPPQPLTGAGRTTGDVTPPSDPPPASGARLGLPSREAQLAQALRHFERDGVVMVKERPGNVADDVVRWAEAHGMAVTRHRRTLGAATHWEIRRQ